MKIKRYRFRLLILLILMTSGLYFLLSQLQRIQLQEKEEWEENVPTDKTETVRVPPVRGDIVDRTGVVLATNKFNYELDINLETVKKHYQENWETKLERETVGRRGDGMLAKRKETDIAAIAENTILPRLRSLGFSKKVSSRALRSHYATHRGLVGFKYSDTLTFTEFCMLAEQRTSLPGVETTVSPRRTYPLGTLAGHVIGRTKIWAKGNIPEAEQNIFNHYVGDPYGDAGVEATMNDYLRGVPGKRTISRGPKGVYIGVREETLPSAGATVELTLHAGLQSHVEGLLRNVGRGGISVIDVTTGEILALATVPTIDQNDYIPRISHEKFSYYTQNPASPFLNNALQEHQPGSVFKLPVALAAAQAGLGGYQHRCVGYETYGRNSRKVHCWLTSGHGTLSMTSAIQRSCNPYFMSLANQLGSKRVVDVFGMLGFGAKTGIQVTAEEAGIVPGSLNWKRHIRPGSSMTSATLANLAIGQQDSSASTLQVAAATAAIANNGKYMQPRIVKSVNHPEKGLILDDQPVLKLDLTQEGISEQALGVIRRGMWMAVNKKGGTASPVWFSDTVQAAAKTGTAQTHEFGKKSNNAWTTAFAPYDNPRYAVCAVVIGGTSGGKVAGPLVRETFKALFAESLPEPKVMDNYKGHINGVDELLLTPEERAAAAAASD